jgi:hypothetical protein
MKHQDYEDFVNRRMLWVLATESSAQEYEELMQSASFGQA